MVCTTILRIFATRVQPVPRTTLKRFIFNVTLLIRIPRNKRCNVTILSWHSRFEIEALPLPQGNAKHRWSKLTGLLTQPALRKQLLALTHTRPAFSDPLGHRGLPGPLRVENAAIVCPEAVSDAIPLVQQNSKKAPPLRKKGKIKQTALFGRRPQSIFLQLYSTEYR